MSPEPKRFARFEVLGQLGKGAQGAVLKARDPTTGRPIALKVLLRVDARSERRFRQEAQVLARLEHPGIVRVVDAGVEGGVPWLAMHLVEGRSLTDRVEKEGPLAPLEAARVAADLARAIRHCHAQGIVHRDLKPDNVLFEAASGRPVLVDFGLLQRDAEVFGALSIDARSRLSKTGELRGTPAFMAPEQVDSKRYGEVGPATDIYALGAVLFFLLTGQLVHEADSLLGVIAAILEGKRDDVRVRRPDVPAPLADACARALSQQPAERFPTAEAMAAALERCFAPAEPPPAGRRLLPWIVALGVLLALGALLTLIGVELRSRRPARVRVESDAAASVSLGDRVLGEVAPDRALEVELAAGAVVLVARRDGVTLERAVQLEPDTDVTVTLDLVIEVGLDPGEGCALRVRDAGGSARGELAAVGTLRLPIGRYELEVRAPGQVATRAPLEVRPDGAVHAMPAPRPTHRVMHTTRLPRAVRSPVVVAPDLDGDGGADLLVTQHLRDPGRFDTRLVALSGRDGRELWAHAGIYAFASATSTPGHVLCPGRGPDGRAHLTWLDARTGAVVRTGRLAEPTVERWPGAPVLLDGATDQAGVAVFVAPTDAAADSTEEVVALGPDGQRLWRVTRAALAEGGRGEKAVAVVAPFDDDGDGRRDVILWAAGSTVSAISPSAPDDPDGPRWSVRARAPVTPSATNPAVVPSPGAEAVVVSWTLKAGGGDLLCLGPGGRERWRRELAVAPQLVPVWVDLRPGRPADLMVALKKDPADGLAMLLVLDSRTGAPLVSERHPEASAPPRRVRARDGRSFFATYLRAPTALRLVDHELREAWRAPLAGPGWAWPHVGDLDGDGDDELLLVQQEPGLVLAIDLTFPD